MINNQWLQQGAQAARVLTVAEPGWQPISSAPKDGTVIEVRCTYGVAPWYGLFRWTKQITIDGATFDSPGWHRVGDDRIGFTEDSTFTWRPYNGASSAYVDPTDGAQMTDAYWRGAAAAKAGLPLDAFEPSRWTRLWNWLRGESK